MARSKAGKWAEKHAFFAKEFNTIWAASQDIRREAVRDRRFYSITGAQWEGNLGDQYADLPKFEMNLIHQSVIRIFSEYRANRITVKYRPGDVNTDTTSAETLIGRYRADEQRSDAGEAYDNCFEEGVGGGMGAFRFRVVDEDDEEDNDDEPGTTRANIEPIFDADSSVFFNLGAKKYTKADAERCYVITSYPTAEYEARWGDKFSMTSWQIPKDSVYFDWATPAVVYVCEVYEIEHAGITYHIYQQDASGEELKLTDDDLTEDTDGDGKSQAEDLAAMGYTHVRDEKAKRRKVHKWTMNGSEIMYDDGIVPGKYAPVVVYYGKRWYVDNVERFMGQVRLATDAQRLVNMLISRLAELNTLTPYEIPIFTAEQIAGHQYEWANANQERKPFRTINGIMSADGTKTPAGPLGTVKPPDVPPALAALFQAMTGAIKEMTGGGMTQDDITPANIAQKTVNLLIKRMDMQSFIYTDNMAKSMAHAGRVWLEIQKDIMPDDEHDAPSLAADGTQSFVKMVTPGVDANGKPITINDPRAGKYDVYTDVGPQFKSQRDSTIEALTELMSANQTDPQIQSVLMSAIVMNMEGEGLDDIRAYFRKKLVTMGVIPPTPEEEQEAQQAQQSQPPDPNATFLNAQAEESIATAADKRADAVLKGAQTAKAAAEAGTTLQDALQTAQASQPQQGGIPPTPAAALQPGGTGAM